MPYLRLQILGVVVGGVLGVHLLFPHFAHEAGNVACSAGLGGHFRGLRPPLRLSSSLAAAAAPRPSADLPPPPRSHSGAGSGGRRSLSLSLFPCELLPSPRPAGPSSGGPAAERGALGAAAAVPGGGAGLAASGRRARGRGRGAVLSPAPRPPGEPRARPAAGQPRGQRGAGLRGGERSGGSELRLREGRGGRARSRRGSDLINRVGLCYRLCAARSGAVMRGAGFREGWGPFRRTTFGCRRRVCRAVRSRRNCGAKTRTAATKPDRSVLLVLSASLHLYLCQLCRCASASNRKSSSCRQCQAQLAVFSLKENFPNIRSGDQQRSLICRYLK